VFAAACRAWPGGITIRAVSASTPTSATSSIIRPRLRGVADYYATAASIPGVALLIAGARPGAATTAAAVYGVCLVILLIGSTLYHMPHWSVRTLLWLQRIDHANIYLMIAGSCTPLGLALMPGPGGWLLVAMWTAAGLGILKCLVWPGGPRRLNAGLYVLMGALTLPYVSALKTAVGPDNFLLLATGGLLYLISAIVYSLRWPNPVPLVFGYHEVFHLFVFSAAFVHFVAIWRLVT